jgi:hypothetical protein
MSTIQKSTNNNNTNNNDDDINNVSDDSMQDELKSFLNELKKPKKTEDTTLIESANDSSSFSSTFSNY